MGGLQCRGGSTPLYWLRTHILSKTFNERSGWLCEIHLNSSSACLSFTPVTCHSIKLKRLSQTFSGSIYRLGLQEQRLMGTGFPPACLNSRSWQAHPPLWHVTHFCFSTFHHTHPVSKQVFNWLCVITCTNPVLSLTHSLWLNTYLYFLSCTALCFLSSHAPWDAEPLRTRHRSHAPSILSCCYGAQGHETGAAEVGR